MRLEIDLRFDATRGQSADEQTDRLDLSTLAAAARSPVRLWPLLRAKRYAEVVVDEGELPLSAVQAACLVFVAAVPTPRFSVEGRQLSRTAFLGRALLKAAVALPSELLRTAVLALRVSRASRHRSNLPLQTVAPKSALYLRIDATLNWMGLQVGGAATHTAGVINGLAENGVDVEIFAPERPAGAHHGSFTPVRQRRTLQIVPGLAFADYSDQVVRAAEGRPADFVYQRYRLGSDAGLRVAERLGVPLVLEFNGSEIWVERQWASGSVRLGRALTALERRNLRDASLIVVVSRALRETAVAEGASPERILVNPNGVDVEALASYRALTPAEWRRRLRMPDEPTVGFVGTFGPWHGVTLLPALVHEVPAARWIIIGDGQLFPDVQAEMSARQLDHRVLLTGLVERPRALELLACCDVCVSPHVPNPDGTEFFGSPTKLFEYMGLRKPIVASRLGQIATVLTHEQTALLTTPGDVKEAAAAIRILLADEPQRDRIAHAAFNLATSNYTWAAHVRRILDALQDGTPGDAGQR